VWIISSAQSGNASLSDLRLLEKLDVVFLAFIVEAGR
jgi:hypothetical protein